MVTPELLANGFDEDNDFRSLTLSPVETNHNLMYRELYWNEPVKKNGGFVRRASDPAQNEISNGYGRVIRNPLKVNGGVRTRASSVYLVWHRATGNFMGPYQGTGYLLPAPELIEYAEQRMGLHDFEFEFNPLAEYNP